MSKSKRFGIHRPNFAAIFQGGREGGRSCLGRLPAGRSLPSALAFIIASACLSGCVMSEEMKRIDATKKAEQARQESGSTNLTGEQIFIRTCNTCHPGGAAGMGPSLENLAKDFPDDAKLRAFLRKGKGMMPPQPKEVLNEQEMDNLIGYLRALEVSK